MKKAIYALVAAGFSLSLSTTIQANPTGTKVKSNTTKQLSSAVKWTQQSGEFPLLTSYLYQQAAQSLRQRTLPKTPWLVIMDIDETLLNNSDYNKRLDLGAGTYSAQSWRAWVHEKSATAIPGAIDFVNTVLELGGQLALVTNRNQLDDAHTWQNLINVGFPIDKANTCLVGRRPQDKSAIDNTRYINDKDLRREEFVTGAASLCWSSDSKLESQWHKAFTLVFQVGDNIEDIAKTTQHNANVDQLLKRQGKDILILPNAMYGSWAH